jgi:hypothetical protein
VYYQHSTASNFENLLPPLVEENQSVLLGMKESKYSRLSCEQRKCEESGEESRDAKEDSTTKEK